MLDRKEQKVNDRQQKNCIFNVTYMCRGLCGSDCRYIYIQIRFPVCFQLMIFPTILTFTMNKKKTRNKRKENKIFAHSHICIHTQKHVQPPIKFTIIIHFVCMFASMCTVLAVYFHFVAILMLLLLFRCVHLSIAHSDRRRGKMEQKANYPKSKYV